MNSWISTNGHFQKSRENHIKDEFVKIQEFTLVIIFVISPQKSRSKKKLKIWNFSEFSLASSLRAITPTQSFVTMFRKLDFYFFKNSRLETSKSKKVRLWIIWWLEIWDTASCYYLSCVLYQVTAIISASSFSRNQLPQKILIVRNRRFAENLDLSKYLISRKSRFFEKVV